MTYYVTKYALTRGIMKAPAASRIYESTQGVCKDYLTWHVAHRHAFLPPQHYTSDATKAILRAEEMRKDKIASLKKQIKKLEALTFSVDACKEAVDACKEAVDE